MCVGDVISVVGEMNVSGYYTAEFEGRRGLVPAAFVQEMNIDDKDAQYRLLNQVSIYNTYIVKPLNKGFLGLAILFLVKLFLAF